MRREWIEILSHKYGEKEKKKSPSMRREWIEMHSIWSVSQMRMSPSMRREWIEI